MNRKAWAVAAAFLSTGIAQATCYSVYKADGTLIQEGSTTPVNLTLPLGDTVPEKFGHGASMTVSDLGFFCKDRSGGDALQKTGTGASREEAKKAGDAEVKQAAAEGSR